jgi:hypothetical protein
MVKFESDENEEPMVYPGKVLALYEDTDGNLKALIHSTDYKTSSKVEETFGFNLPNLPPVACSNTSSKSTEMP